MSDAWIFAHCAFGLWFRSGDLELSQHHRFPGFFRVDPADTGRDTFCVSSAGIHWINPDGCQRSSMKLCLEPAACWTSPDESGENKWCPEGSQLINADIPLIGAAHRCSIRMRWAGRCRIMLKD